MTVINKEMEYMITVGIDAPDVKKAEKIALQLIEIRNALNDEDLEALAKILKEKPGIVHSAKILLGKK